MKFIINELNKYVNIENKKINELIDIFTSLSFEVEEVSNVSNINGVKLTKVLDCVKHPNADTLSYLKTEIDGEIREVVCGGQNIQTGQIVAHAIPGSTVGKFQMGSKELRGIESAGMILSVNEILNITKEVVEDSEKENIYVFDQNTNLSLDINDLLDIKGKVFDLSILPDRQYASSYFSMAREVAAFLNKEYNWNIDEVERIGETKANILLGEKANSLFATDVILKNSKTPFYIKKVLYFSGIRPKDTIEDVIAYVMLITGSVTYLMDRNINLKLDGRNLNNVDLFKSSPVQTQNCEAMFVTPSSSLRSNFINEKNIDLTYGVKNIKGSTTEMAELSSKLIISVAKDAGYLVEASTTTFEIMDNEKTFEIDDKYIASYLGQEINLDNIIIKLNKIGIRKEGNTYFIPSYRSDINYKADVIEEILRFYGIENITPKVHENEIKADLFEPHKNALIKITDELVKYGLFEVKTYQLITEELSNKYNIWNIETSSQLLDEYSIEYNTLQNSLLYGLVDTFVMNHKKDKTDIRLFELSNVYHNQKPIFTIGILHDEFINKKNPILGTKELVLRTLETINIKSQDVEFIDFKNDVFNPYICSKILVNGKQIGIIGEIHPSILRENKLIRLDKIKAKLFYAEIQLEEVF